MFLGHSVDTVYRKKHAKKTRQITSAREKQCFKLQRKMEIEKNLNTGKTEGENT